jgi:UDP-4-amino-4,6-dideoxy-N-acetyl-beta-L-altrosamine N-acetyltransferase
MIKLEKNGVKLERLTEDKIEVVRQWRNESKISQYMEFRDHITPKMQIEWFDKINNDRNYYYLIYTNNRAVGMVNIKKIENRCGETGIFIYDDNSMHTNVAKLSYLILLDFSFNILKLDMVYAHILKDNTRSIIFHFNFGYKLCDAQNLINNQRYSLTKSDYANSFYKIKFN